MVDSDDYEPVPSLPSDYEPDEPSNVVDGESKDDVYGRYLGDYDSDDEKNGVEYNEEEQEIYRRLRDNNNWIVEESDVYFVYILLIVEDLWFVL